MENGFAAGCLAGAIPEDVHKTYLDLRERIPRITLLKRLLQLCNIELTPGPQRLLDSDDEERCSVFTRLAEPFQPYDVKQLRPRVKEPTFHNYIRGTANLALMRSRGKSDSWRADVVRACYEEAIDQINDDPSVLSSYGFLHDTILGQSDDAYRYHARAIRANPRHPRALYYYGMFMSKQNHDDVAKRAFLRVIDIEPEHLNARKELANLTLHKLNDVNEALKLYEQNLERDPTSLRSLTGV
jgi:tetratricopeptide (TPR) repeat protein